MKKKDKKEERFVLLIETGDPGEARVIRMKLEAFGIPCAKDEAPGRVFGGAEIGPAWYKVFVPEDRLELAREAIKPGLIDPAEGEEEKKE